MRQTLAIFIDAYRELNSKKLFWIVLLLSVIVVLAFAAVGIDEKGLTILWWSLPAPFNTTLFSRELFYKLMFANLGVKFWLAWASTILALIATAGIFPDLMASGSIELTLSKPISRLRLFLTKFASGLLFTTVQVALFTGAVFLAFGLRAKVWEPGLFWSVPLMVIFFSYLFSICVLLGVLTRSTVAALLVTLLIWLIAIFGPHSAERTILMFVERNAAQVERLEGQVAKAEKQVQEQQNPPEPGRSLTDRIFRNDPAAELERKRKQLADLQNSGRTIRRWHFATFALKTVMPKTGETLDLLERVLISQADMDQLRRDNDRGDDFPSGPDEVAVNVQDVAERVEKRIRSRSVAWVIGTSLAFESLMLAIAAFIFCRRDF